MAQLRAPIYEEKVVDYILGKDWSKFPANSFVIRRSSSPASRCGCAM